MNCVLQATATLDWVDVRQLANFLPLVANESGLFFYFYALQP